MMKIGDTGQRIKDFQQKLLDLGELMPRWGADGDLGTETLDALTSLCKSHGRARDPDPKVVSEAEQNFVDALVELLRTPPEAGEPARLIDRRQFASKKWDYGQRGINDIWGMTAHQTACWLSVSKDPARCDTVGAAFVIMADKNGFYGDGDVIWLHDDERLVVHGNEFNTKCTSFEIDGLFAGLEGDPTTVWDDPSTPWKETAGTVSELQIESAMQLVRWRRAETIRKGGVKFKVLNTHRQSSASRRNDPGSKVVQRVLVPLWAELGLTDGGPGSLAAGADGGYPNPREWIPNDPARAPYGYHDPARYS